MWYLDYEQVSFEPKVIRYTCIPSEEGFRYISTIFDEPSTNKTNKFGRLDKWVLDKHNFVENTKKKFMEAQEIDNLIVKYVPVTPKRTLRRKYRELLRNSILEAIKETKNGLH